MNHFTQNKIWAIARIIILSLPVFIFCFQLSFINAGHVMYGDWDYFAQIYEAARQSILYYHQFPWWNPWSVGGVPLYANPQFGLISIQMPLVLVFGTLTGLHIAITCYFVLGFWGMFLLLKRINHGSGIISALLSYLWVFSGFPVSQLAVGHLTFGTYLLSPWLFLAILSVRSKGGWLWLGLVMWFFIEQSPHYITIEALLIGLLIAICNVCAKLESKNKKALIKAYLKALVITLVLSSLKLLMVMQYLHEFPRFTTQDVALTSGLVIASLAYRHFPHKPFALGAAWGWWEYEDYIGVVTLVIFLYQALLKLLSSKRTSDLLLLIGILLMTLIAMGPFSSYSPYALLHHLPIFGQTRVPSRWLGWTCFGIIIFLAKIPSRRIIIVLLVLSIADVFSASYGVINVKTPQYKEITSTYFIPEQTEYFGHSLMLMPLYTATRANIGSVYGYEPIINFNGDYNPQLYSKLTNRCGINQGCNFVLTNNATVTYWSPQKIVLKRTRPGVIKLDMNPGKVWLVNGKAVFDTYRLFELKKDFTLPGNENSITITYNPTL